MFNEYRGARRLIGRKAKQAGVNILQVLIGTVVGAIALVAAVNAVQGQRAEAQLNEGFAFIANEMSQALSAYYFSNSRSYIGIAAGVSGAAATPTTATGGAQILTTRFGLRNEMPWGEDWWTVNAASTRNAITLRFNCANIGPNQAVIDQRCGQLTNSINNARVQQLTDGAGVGTCALTAGGSANVHVLCAYRRPL